MQKAVPASNHKHIIGLLRCHDGYELVTVDCLRNHIREQKEFNTSIMRDPCFAELKWMLRPEHSFRDYGDRRCNTGLYHFDHCPECGTAINWKTIREIPD